MSKNDDFRAFAQEVLDAVFERGEDAVAELEDERVELTAQLGENIQVVGARRHRALRTARCFARTSTRPRTRSASSSRRSGSPELARQLAMHISFARPTYRSRDEVPAELVEAEREILLKQPDVESKPADVREKIVEGMLNKRFYAESVLGEQTWIHDNGLTVAKALEQGGLRARRLRLVLGRLMARRAAARARSRRRPSGGSC